MVLDPDTRRYIILPEDAPPRARKPKASPPPQPPAETIAAPTRSPYLLGVMGSVVLMGLVGGVTLAWRLHLAQVQMGLMQEHRQEQAAVHAALLQKVEDQERYSAWLLQDRTALLDTLGDTTDKAAAAAKLARQWADAHDQAVGEGQRIAEAWRDRASTVESTLGKTKNQLIQVSHSLQQTQTEAERTATTLSQQLSQLDKEAAGYKDLSSRLEREAGSYKSLSHQLDGENGRLRSSVSSLESDNSSLRNQVSCLQGEVSGLRSRVCSLESELSSERGRSHTCRHCGK